MGRRNATGESLAVWGRKKKEKKRKKEKKEKEEIAGLKKCNQ